VTYADLCAIIGEPAAQRLVAAWGGTRHYIARTPSPELIRIMDEPAAQKLCSDCAGLYLLIPRSRRDYRSAERIAALHRQGLAPIQIAAKVGCTRRTVHRALARKIHD
jgi:hypothetical protein